MADDFGKEVRDFWAEAEEADRENRDEALLDLRIAANDQWDERDRQMREYPPHGQLPRPCLTINTTLQFIAQVTGDREANPTSIKVLPREDGDREVADVRSDLVRAIELQSKADRIYIQAFQQAVTCGIGNFRVDLDYAYDDAFERDLFIRGVPNPLAVMWDPLAADVTGRDAERCIVADKIGRDEYAKRFPKAAATSLFDQMALSQGWCDKDTVRIGEYWELVTRKRTIALMADGSVRDVTDEPEAKWKPMLWKGPDGQPRVREAPCKYAVMTLTNGQEELADPFELKIPRLPIIRVTGQEIWVGDKRVRFGMVRLLRDHQRMKNYLRSVATEKLMYAPRANFIAMVSAIKGRESDWPNAMVFNDGAPAPVPVTETNLQSLITLSEMCAQDMKDVTGIHDASLGIRSNETSGVAIQQRQQQGDIATIGYHANMNSAMQEAGEVLNALIPVAYDTPRTLRLIGEDGAAQLIRANDPDFAPTALVKNQVDLTTGRYDVTITTGPQYLTRRQEAAAGMIDLARASPAIIERTGDLIAEAQDWPNAEKFAERLRPPGTLDPDEMTPEQQQQAAQAAQQQAMQQQMQMQAAQLEMAAKEAETRLKIAQAEEAEANARKALAQADKAEAETMDLKATLALSGAGLAAAGAKLQETV